MSATTTGTAQATSSCAIHRQRDWGTPFLLVFAFLLLASAVVAYAYPWADEMHRFSGSVAPETPRYQRPLAATITNWCVDFSPYGEERQLSLPMRDDGSAGDKLAGDGVYTLHSSFVGAGIHHWRVVACDYPSIAFPDAPAWLWVTGAGQTLVLTFDTSSNAVTEAKGVWPTTFVANASDQPPPYYVFGSINDWQIADEQTRLRKLPDKRFRLVYRVPNKGFHLATIATEVDGDLYGYMADGRSDSWNMLQFETQRPDEVVVFELDSRNGQSAILFEIPRFLSWLAYDGGASILLLLLSAAAALLMFFALWRYQLIRRPDLLARSGCPSCVSGDLIRVPRTASMHLSRFAGINTGLYECRQCAWSGLRLVGGEVVKVIPNRATSSNRQTLLSLLLLLLFSTALAIQLRSHLGHSPSLPATVESLASEMLELAESLDKLALGQFTEKEDEPSDSASGYSLESMRSQGELQGNGFIDDIVSRIRRWLKESGLVVPSAPAARIDSAQQEEEASESEQVPGYSPVQYDHQEAPGISD